MCPISKKKQTGHSDFFFFCINLLPANVSSLVKQRIWVFTQFKILKISIKTNLQRNKTQKHFRCVPGFIKTADRQFPPKFTAKYIQFSDSEITGKLAGNQSWCFQNGVFTLQRKKKNYHLSPRQLNNELSKCEVWCNIDCFRHSWRVDWHVQSSVLCSTSNLEWTHYEFQNQK